MKFPQLLTSIFSRPNARYWGLTLLLWVAMVAPASAASSVILRVAIERDVNRVKVGSSTAAVVKDSSGRSIGEIPAMSAFYAQAGGGGVSLDRWQSGLFWIEPANSGFVYINDRWYRGKTLVVPSSKGLTAVNYVDLEEYLYSVLGGEMDGNWPQEALKAQAVAARTYALYKRESSKNSTFDVGDTPQWQIYKGVMSESPGTYSAVDKTSGQVLTYNNRLALSAFHACAGGHTEDVKEVWGGENYPYLQGVPDFDGSVKECNWQRNFTAAELSRKISGVGTVKSILPATTMKYGSIKTAKVVGDKGTRIVTGDSIRDALGLKSVRFQFVNGGNAGFVVQGRGFGHSVGMSQWGAYTLAQQRVTYLQILGHYYRGASLSKLQVR